MNERKKQTIKICVFVTSVFVIFLSVTYAFINVQLTGTKKQVLSAGNLELELDEDENNLTITDAMPMYDDVGMIQEDEFTFRLVNKTTTDTSYIVKLVDITIGDKLDKAIVKYGLTKDEENTIDLLSNLENMKIDTGTITGNATIEYSLRLWIDSSVTDNSVIKNKSLSYKIEVEVSQEIENGGSTSTIATTLDLESKVDTETTNINFLQISSDTNGKGIYKYLEYGEDIYYWRGEVTDNHVVFGGYCWKMVRTTKSGGVKMIYDGVSNNSKCTNTGKSSQLSSTSVFNSTSDSPANVGYMYGSTEYVYKKKTTSDDAELTTAGILYGYDVEWDESSLKYNLVSKDSKNLFSSTGTFSNDRENISDGNHYTCFSTDSSCDTVSYVIYTGSTVYLNYVELNGGAKIEQALEQMYSNDHDSVIKSTIESWFGSSVLANAENLQKLEDIVYCNDRSTIDSSIDGWNKDGDTSNYLKYSTYMRMINGTPSLECKNINDSFTYKDTINGNGLLKWPVGLLTVDEVILAGGQSSSNKNYYLYTGSMNYWTISPRISAGGLSDNFLVSYSGMAYNANLNNSYGLRPVISLASTVTFVSGGEGTVDNPYVVAE